jgi:hypothetical protein
MTRFVLGGRTADCFNPLWERRTQLMCRTLGVAAVAAVLWIGTANFVQGFS